MKKNQQGFSVIQLFIILIAVSILGFTGWYVWHAKQVANKNLVVNHSSQSVGQKQAKNKTTTAPIDPYASWHTYSASTAKISFKYPANWSVSTDDSNCTGAVLSTVTPSSTDIMSAAKIIGKSELKKYAILFYQYGNQSSQCAADGNDFKGAKFAYLKSSDRIMSGIFRDDYVTFYGSSTGDTSASLPDTGIVTGTKYTAQSGFVDAGTVTANGKTYQISINTDNGQYTQSSEPVELNPSLLAQTDLYKNTLLLLNSVQ